MIFYKKLNTHVTMEHKIYARKKIALQNTSLKAQRLRKYTENYLVSSNSNSVFTNFYGSLFRDIHKLFNAETVTAFNKKIKMFLLNSPVLNKQ